MSPRNAAASRIDRAARPDNPTVSVVIPARNEAANLAHLLPLLPAEIDEVVLVDGNSTDDTIAVTRDLVHPDKLRVITQTGRGKGNALAEGLLAATCDIAVMIDADCSMDPAEIHSFVGALRGGADVVKGSRYTTGGGSVDLSGLRSIGNKALNLATTILYGTRWDELCYGYAAFWTDVLPVLGLDKLATSAGVPGRLQYGSGFEIEAILFCRSARAGLRVAEVPSFEYERLHGHSNLVTFSDGWRVLTAILRERTFTPTGASAWAASTYLPGAKVHQFPTAVSAGVDAELAAMTTAKAS